MKAVQVTVYVPDDVDLDESALDAIESAAENEAYEQVLYYQYERDNHES